MIKVGDKVEVVYDARPLQPVEVKSGVVSKVTRSGFIKIKTGNPIWDALLFHAFNLRNARGWNTLSWREVRS